MERILMDFTELFCDVDDFCREFEPLWCQRQISDGRRRRRRKTRLSLSERMTIVIAFHSSGYRDFKHFYSMLIARHRADFPGLVSYARFVRQMPVLAVPLCAYLQTGYGQQFAAFIDDHVEFETEKPAHGCFAQLGKSAEYAVSPDSLVAADRQCGRVNERDAGVLAVTCL